MDFTGINPVSTSYAVDPITNVLTVTFLNGLTPLGTLSMELVRFRAFAEALAEMSRKMTDDYSIRQRARMLYSIQQKSSEITFG